VQPLGAREVCHNDGPAKVEARLHQPGRVLDCPRGHASGRPPARSRPDDTLHLELLIPSLFWTQGQGADVMRGIAAPTLERWLSRGRPGASIPGTADRWLWRRFTAPAADAPAEAPTEAPAPQGRALAGAAGTPVPLALPLAPVTLAVDGGDPGRRWWMRADPVHFVIGRTGLRLAPPSLLQLREEEAAALATAVRAHFPEIADDLRAPVPGRWYLGADEDFALETTAPADAIGDDVDRNLPRGPGRRRWLGFVNEVQMLWFDHPVNQARERHGEPVASSLWLHGPGRMPDAGQPGCAGASGGGELLAGLAALAGCRWLPAGELADPWLGRTAAGRWLLVLDPLVADAQAGDPFRWRTALECLDAGWLAPLDRALRAGAIARIDLHWPVHGSLSTLHVAAADRFRVWRRQRPLATFAALPAGRTDA
jgi:hypothetical protein